MENLSTENMPLAEEPPVCAASAESAGKKRLWQAPLVCFALAFVCITIVSRCSFLYRFNDWSDVNWFVSMGHGIVDGKVPYKDLFEQKGVLIYLLFALAYLISGNSFIGVYLFEVLFAFCYLFVSYKILRLWLAHAKALGALVAVALFTYCSSGFAMGGGAVEEYCLPMLAFLLYVFLKYALGGGERIPLWQVALCGLFAGFIFWIKYTMLAFYAVAVVCIFVDRCIKKDVKSAFIYAAVFIAAFALASLPALIYLGVNGALGDMWQVYIINNIFNYGSGNTAAQILNDIGNTVANIAKNFFIYLFAVFALVWFVKGAGVQRCFRAYYIAIAVVFLVVQGLYQGSHLYYHFAFAVYMPLGVAGSAYCAQGIYDFFYNITARRRAKRGKEAPVRADLADKAGAAMAKCKVGLNVRTVAILAALCVVVCLLCGNCTIEIFFSKSYYPQFAVAERIEEREEERGAGTLICYKIADAGFYTACDRSPDYYYFALNNFTREGFPELYEGQESYVSGGGADFVITTPEVWESERETLLSAYAEVDEGMVYSYVHFESHLWRSEDSYVLLESVSGK